MFINPTKNDTIFKNGKLWKVNEVRSFTLRGKKYIIFTCRCGDEYITFEKNGVLWDSIPEEIKAELV